MSFPLLLSLTLAAAPPPLVTGLKNPESAAVAFGGRVFVSVIGEFNADGDGGVVEVVGGKAVPFVSGLNDPKGLAALGPWLYVTDKTRVLRIDAKGQTDVVAAADAFPAPPLFLNDIVVDPESQFAPVLYVSDSGDKQGAGGAVYRIATPRPAKKGANAPAGKPAVTLVADGKAIPGLHTPNGLAMDGRHHLLVGDFGTGDLHRVRLADRTAEKVAGGFNGTDGLAWDHYGRLFVSDWKTGKLFGIPKPGATPVQLPVAFQAAADICVDHANRRLLVPDMKAGTVSAVPTTIPGAEVDESPLPLRPVVAFPNLKWKDWQTEDAGGKQVAFRPMLLTHAGDGSNRAFVGEQRGTIFAFANDQGTTDSTVFLDIRDKVQYDDRTNEEGLLGLAFHPRFKETGEAFVYYTPKGQPPAGRTNVVARFKLKKGDPTALDPASEEVVYKFENRPFWNHAGGPIVFGPDGFLYIAHGDGGSADDPHDNGQNLNSVFGKILRIDVDKKAGGKNYAVPADNPFIGRADARPEIYAYGLRNVWKMAFDKKTGELWAGEVGQNLFEEVNRIEKGGNYGWNRREAFHPFGPKGVGCRPEYIDPVWEYHHDVGKSITGGGVYRGTKLSDLDGHFLYADYVTNRLWALKYDPAAKRVVANRTIPDVGKPVFAFGEDEKGEAYFMTSTPSAKECIYTFAK